MKRTLRFLAVLCSLAVAGQAAAVTISLTPADQTIWTGQTATVDLGITLGAAETLDGFNLALLFDPAILRFDGFAYGGTIGGDYLAGVDYTDPTAVLLSGFYGGAGTQLANGAFTLGTFSFFGQDLGTSALTMPGVGPYANAVLLAGVPAETFVTASGSISAVPEPATVFLLGSGLVGLARFGLRRKKG